MRNEKTGKNEYIDERGQVKKRGFLAWFRNYGYYYKSHLIAGLVVLSFIIALVLSMNSVQPDLRVYFVVNEEPDPDAFKIICDNIYEYVIDVDRDDVSYMEPTTLVLKDNPSNSAQRNAYQALDAAFEDDNILVFVTDEYGYNYLMDRGVVRDMAFFGIASDEEYRLRMSETTLWEGVEGAPEYFLVFKYISDEKYEDIFTSSISTMLVGMCYELVGEVNPNAAG